MTGSLGRFTAIADRVAAAAENAGRPPSGVTIVAVTKTFPSADILPVIEGGHRVFGENRVQEAHGKWPQLKKRFADLRLHLIGPLQSNKAKEAVALFDTIETVDREKIARALAREMQTQQRFPELYVQVNTGQEPQKAGVAPGEAPAFVDRCRNEFGLEIGGLMCIPPFDENPGPYFALLAKLAGVCGAGKLSMGMSADFETAISMGATHVRIGTAIFGDR